MESQTTPELLKQNPIMETMARQLGSLGIEKPAQETPPPLPSAPSSSSPVLAATTTITTTSGQQPDPFMDFVTQQVEGMNIKNPSPSPAQEEAFQLPSRRPRKPDPKTTVARRHYVHRQSSAVSKPRRRPKTTNKGREAGMGGRRPYFSACGRKIEARGVGWEADREKSRRIAWGRWWAKEKARIEREDAENEKARRGRAAAMFNLSVSWEGAAAETAKNERGGDEIEKARRERAVAMFYHSWSLEGTAAEGEDVDMGGAEGGSATVEGVVDWNCVFDDVPYE